MDKIKRTWKLCYVPMLFAMGALCFLANEMYSGCLFVVIASNEVITKD